MRAPHRSIRLLAVLLLVATAGGFAHADPCDFTGADAFPWQQVMDCYRSVPYQSADRDNIVEVLGELRPYSDLAEIYDERYGWQANLAALGAMTFADDFSLHDAVRLEHKQMTNPHVRYLAPACYTQMLAGYLPFDFGVTRRFGGSRQPIVFIEKAPTLPDLYRQTTGIDPREYVGMRVVSINGVPTLEYFRQFGSTRVRWDDADSTNLNAILNRLSYSLRSSNRHDFAPDHAADVMLLESRDGTTTEVSFPWIFAKRGLLGMFQVSPTSSTAEFIALCNEPYPLPFPNLSSTATSSRTDSFSKRPAAKNSQAAELLLDRADRQHPLGSSDMEKSRFVNNLSRGTGVNDEDFYEVPPHLYDTQIQEIVPLTNNAKVLQFGDDTTVIRLYNTIGWIDVARQGVEHACQNSENLILDLRRNNGGNDTTIRWLYAHLFPDVPTAVDAGKIPLRMRNDLADANEIQEVYGLIDQHFGTCVGLGPSCWMDIGTEMSMSINELEWYVDPSVTEQRGGASVSLTRQIGLGESPTVFDAASCVGKFDKEHLIVLTDGTNCSGGYFLVSPFIENDVATVVTMGGYVGEEIAMGSCRTGATMYLTNPPYFVNFAEGEGITQVDASPPIFHRNVDSFMEMPGAYLQDRTRLHFDAPLGYDRRLYVWSDCPETDGYVYGKVLGAIQDPEGYYFSVSAMQIAGGQVLRDETIYTTPTDASTIDAFLSFLPSSAGLDALDVQPHRILFSTKSNAVVFATGGAMVLWHNRLYQRLADGSIAQVGGGAAGLNVRTLDAVDEVDSGYVFSVSTDQFAAGTILRQQNAYLYDPHGKGIVPFFDGGLWGLQTLDCVDVSPGDPLRIGFSVARTQFFSTTAFSGLLRHELMYVLDTETGEVEPVIDGLGLRSLDACSGFGR